MSPEPRVAIVGAGPYALSTAAFLGRAGVEANVYGEVMGFWRTMPAGMFLRSYRKQSNIADPARALTLDAYETQTGRKLGTPVSLEEFIEYGVWFQQQSKIDVDPRRVHEISRHGNGFRLVLDDGETRQAANVVVAAGIGPFAWRPPLFDGLDSELVSHTSELREFGSFAGRRVLVVGAGQSALEAAVFLGEAGADTELIVRRPSLRFLHGEGLNERDGLIARLLYPEWSVGPPGVNLLMGKPGLYRYLPAKIAEPLAYRAIRPAASLHLKSRLDGVQVTTGRSLRVAREEGGAVRVELDDGGERVADHIVLGTGYRIDLGRYGFLDPGLRGQIRLKGSSPRLSAAFGSSVPGLYFVGAPAAASCGPGLRFVSHSGYAARAITRGVVGRG